MSGTRLRTVLFALVAIILAMSTTTAVAAARSSGSAAGAAAQGAGQSDYSLGGPRQDSQAAISPLHRWALGYDSRDNDMMRDAFTQDARFVFFQSTGGQPAIFEGREAVMGLFTSSLASQTDVRRHVTTNHVIEQLDQRTVRITSYLTLLVIADPNNPPELRATGVYTDTVELERDGVWRISERQLRLDTPS